MANPNTRKEDDIGEAFRVRFGPLAGGHRGGRDVRPARKCGERGPGKRQGNASAQNDVGYAYEKGIGTSVDLGTALVWYQAAADRDNSFGQWNVGRLRGAAGDTSQAAQWTGRSAQLRASRSNVCRARSIRTAMMAAERRAIQDANGAALQMMACAIMGACPHMGDFELLDAKAMDDRQNRGRFQVDLTFDTGRRCAAYARPRLANRGASGVAGGYGQA